jgi:peroxiredoxin
MKSLTYLLIHALLLAVSANAFNQSRNPTAAPNESSPAAPAFNLTSIDGKKFELSSLRGKVIVLNFWFTGCAPCVEEMPKLNSLVDEFKDKDVVFIAPTFDGVAVLQTFLKEHPFKYHIIPNAGGMILGPYSDGTENVVFPMHFVIDREGKIDTKIAGAKDFAKLRKAIASLAETRVEKAQ